MVGDARAGRGEELQQGQRAEVAAALGDRGRFRRQGLGLGRVHPQSPGVFELQDPREQRQRGRLFVLLEPVGQLCHPLPEAQGVARLAVAGPVSRAGEPAGRFARFASFGQVVGDQPGQLVEPVGLELDRRPRGRRVSRRAPVGELGAVGDLAGQRMAEGEQALRVDLRFVEEAGLDQFAERRVDPLGLHFGGQSQRPDAQLLADHRGDLEQLLGIGLEAVDPGGEDRLHGDRHAGVLDRRHQAVGAALALQVAGLGRARGRSPR